MADASSLTKPLLGMTLAEAIQAFVLDDPEVGSQEYSLPLPPGE